MDNYLINVVPAIIIISILITISFPIYAILSNKKEDNDELRNLDNDRR